MANPAAELQSDLRQNCWYAGVACVQLTAVAGVLKTENTAQHCGASKLQLTSFYYSWFFTSLGKKLLQKVTTLDAAATASLGCKPGT